MFSIGGLCIAVNLIPGFVASFPEHNGDACCHVWYLRDRSLSPKLKLNSSSPSRTMIPTDFIMYWGID